MVGVRFRLLGPLEMFDGSQWVAVGPARCRALLAVLLIRRDEVLSVAQLVLALWGDTAPKTAATQVHGHVMRLRRILGDADGRVLVTTPGGYRIERGGRDVDVDLFDGFAEQGRAALEDGRLDDAAEALDRALGMWRGPALVDVAPSHLLSAEIHRLTEQRLVAWELHQRLLADRYKGGSEPEPAAGDQAVVEVPISSLVAADSPRLLGEDAEHVRALAEVDAGLPPIVVHRSTMRIVDGMHRVKAAARRGEAVITARFFDGSDEEAFVLSVKQNIAHGLPLSLADRKAAAARIIVDHAEWSDRAIAAVVGLAPGTVGAIRRRSTDQGGQLNVRIGRDGRVRPTGGAQRRQRVRELIAAAPTMSIRQIAQAADVSVGTAHAVRKSMIEVSGSCAPAGGAALEPDRRQGRAFRRGPARNAGGEPANWPSLRERLRADPALRYSEAGRKLLHWLDANASTAEEWRAVARSVPAHWSDSLALLAYGYATRWRAFADALQREPESAAETTPAS